MTKNPYRVDRVRSFDPKGEYVLTDPVDGFRHLGPEGSLERFLRQRYEAERPAYVLVRGPNGTGRTAAARSILKMYSEIRGARRLIAPQIEPNNDPHDVLKKWIGSLNTELFKASGGKLDRSYALC